MENNNVASRLPPLAPLDGTNNAINGPAAVKSDPGSLEPPCEQQPGLAHQQSLATAGPGRSPVDAALMNSPSAVAHRHACVPSGSAQSSAAVSCSVDMVQQPSQQQQQQHHQLIDASIAGSYGMAVSGGRVSPPCYPGGTYATLTPLQPLPPISTVSEKFSSSTNGNNMGFVFMQHHGAQDLASFGRGPDVYTSYKYEKDVSSGEMTVGERAVNCNGFESSENNLVTVMNGIGTGYSMSQQQQQIVRNLQTQYAMYGHTEEVRPIQVKPDLVSSTGATIDRMSPYDGVAAGIAAVYTSTLMPSSQVPLKSVSSGTMSMGANNMNMQNGSLAASLMAQHGPTTGVESRQQQQLRVGSPDQPSSSTDTHGCDDSSSMPADGNGGEEINTRDVALRVSNELKKYSIPQAVFAQRVLGRSQGTLSDLLRNPKPWSKLKSGRETFRRMWKWLQEPEYQRMAALRIPGPGTYNTPDSANGTSGKQGNIAPKRNRDGTLLTAPHPIMPQQHRPAVAADGIPQQQPSAGGAAAVSVCPAATAAAKKPRMVFTEIQRRTLVAIFKEIKRPSKEIQATIAEQLGLKVSTVVNFFMNARRRSVDKYMDEVPSSSSSAGSGGTTAGVEPAVNSAAVSSTAGPADDPVRQ